MDYFKLLQLKKEPFSNSPDPDFFYYSKRHKVCLQKLELALRLRRGLNVIIGDIGMGKTTLCRELIRRFDADADVRTHLVLDPSFSSASACLKTLYALICKEESKVPDTDMDIKEAIKQRLFTDGVDQSRISVLIIDEGQKITAECIEILRELLNYETNNYKLLQIVIFAQPEIEEILKAHANFADRINWLHYLEPMDFSDTRQMIHHRLKLSSETAKPRAIFTFPALWAIYRFTKGYPRKIVHLCHQSVLAMIIQNRSKAGWAMIRSCRSRMSKEKRWGRRLLVFAASAAVVALAAIYFVAPREIPPISGKTPGPIFKVPTETPTAVQVQAGLHDADQGEAHAVASSDAEQTPEGPVAPTSGQDRTTETTTTAAPLLKGSGEVSSQLDGAETVERPPALSPPEEPVTPPEILGRLSVKPGDTLFQLVQTVYGRATNRNMRAVIEANRHIVNPNAIDLGDVIAFPALEHPPDPSKGERYWIVVERKDRLDRALQRLYALEQSGQVPLRLMSHWSPSKGLVFWLAAQRSFSNPEDAIGYLSALPPELVAEGHVVSEWPDGMRVYAYLY